MTNPEQSPEFQPIVPISEMERARLIEAARALLPITEVRLSGLAQGGILLTSSAEHQLGNIYVTVTQDSYSDDQTGILITTSAEDVDLDTKRVIVWNKRYEVSSTTSRYIEETYIPKLINDAPEHNDVIGSFAIQMSAGLEMRKAMGLDILTPAILDEVLAILEQCNASNKIDEDD